MRSIAAATSRLVNSCREADPGVCDDAPGAKQIVSASRNKGSRAQVCIRIDSIVLQPRLASAERGSGQCFSDSEFFDSPFADSGQTGETSSVRQIGPPRYESVSDFTNVGATPAMIQM